MHFLEHILDIPVAELTSLLSEIHNFGLFKTLLRSAAALNLSLDCVLQAGAESAQTETGLLLYACRIKAKFENKKTQDISDLNGTGQSANGSSIVTVSHMLMRQKLACAALKVLVLERVQVTTSSVLAHY